METFNKKDFVAKYKKLMGSKPKEEIDELVDPDGSPIGGASTGYNDVEIRVAPQQTTDDYVKTARQGPRPYFGYYGTAYSHGAGRDGVGIYEDDETMDEVAKSKMNDLIEKFLYKKNGGNDIVPKTKKSFKDMIEDALQKYIEDKDTEIYRYLTKVKENL